MEKDADELEMIDLKFITASPSGEEQGKMPDGAEVDMEIGSGNDFEANLPASEWKKRSLGFGCRIFIPNTEYGGIIKDIESMTEKERVILRGDTWRGMLMYKVIEPPAGQDHLVLSGELNSIIRELTENKFDGIFVVPEIDTGIFVSNWKIDRYVTLYSAISKLMDAYGCRIMMRYIQPEDLEYGYVSIQAVKISDHTDRKEYGEEGNVHVDIRDCRNGINHLVCAGEGEDLQRVIVHLYVQKDGSIGDKQYYFGNDEKAEVYVYTSADEDQLIEEGTKRLKELMNYKKCQMTVEDIDLEIGDIVAGYDEITDTQVKKPVLQKILKVQDGATTIDYKVKGDD